MTVSFFTSTRGDLSDLRCQRVGPRNISDLQRVEVNMVYLMYYPGILVAAMGVLVGTAGMVC